MPPLPHTYPKDVTGLPGSVSPGVPPQRVLGTSVGPRLASGLARGGLGSNCSSAWSALALDPPSSSLSTSFLLLGGSKGPASHAVNVEPGSLKDCFRECLSLKCVHLAEVIFQFLSF